MFGLMPTPWLLLGGVAAIALIAGACLFEGYHYRGLEDSAALAAAENAAIVQSRTADAITADSAQTAAIDLRKIDDFTQTQIIEAPRYVTKKSDARCPVPLGFVRLHDGAASGVPALPLRSGQSDDDAAGIELSAVAGTVVGNYGQCRAIRQQLIDLQGWITAQRASLDKFAPANP